MPNPRSLAAAFACATLLSACGAPSGDPDAVAADDPAGICSVGEAFQPTVMGLTNFVPATVDSLPFVLTCITPGPTGTMVTVVLPGVTDDLPRAGEYVVERDGKRTAGARSAWAEVHLTVGTPSPAHYIAAGGSVRVSSAGNGVVGGSFEMALDRAPETDVRYPPQTAIRGAFRAPRLQNDAPRP